MTDFQFALAAFSVLALAGLFYFATRYRENAARGLANQQPAPPPPPPPEPPPPPPEPPAPDLEANFGNIRRIPEERDWPDLRSPDRHVFPQRPVPVTRFEELNWKLIVCSPDYGTTGWPETRVSDFPTYLRDAKGSALMQVRTRLRPFYNVILDHKGYFAQASRNLEMNPDYSDFLLEAYFKLPVEQRPVIVSFAGFKNEPEALTFLRYGFDDYTVPINVLGPFYSHALGYILTTLAGPTKGWLWLSLARIRKVAAEQNAQAEAVNAFLKQEVEKRAQEDHANRFAALWQLRHSPVETPKVVDAEPEGDPA